MAKWSGLLPVAMWAGSVGVPAHALQISGAPAQGQDTPLARGSCEDGLAYPFAPDVFPCTPATGSPGDVAHAAFVTAMASAPARNPPPPLLGERVADAELDAVRAERSGGWATQLLAGLVTVGVVVHRRLAWRARGVAIAAVSRGKLRLVASPPPADSLPATGRPDPGAGRAAPSAQRGA